MKPYKACYVCARVFGKKTRRCTHCKGELVSGIVEATGQKDKVTFIFHRKSLEEVLV